MTEAEYSALTAACDALLAPPEADPERVALAWLHVRSEHPHSLEPYQALFARQSAGARAKLWLRHRASNVLTLARSFVQPRTDVLPRSTSFPPAVDVVFISHTVSPSVTAGAPDFYFGTLAEDLAARGLTSLTLLHNHYPAVERRLRKVLTRGGATSRVVLPRWSTVPREWRNLARARAAGRRLLEAGAGGHTDFMARVRREAAAHAPNPATLATLRLASIVQRICMRFRPRTIVTTWEGHGWERIAFSAARSVDSSVRCIGYQHTTLFERSHGLRRSLGRRYDPDAIVTLGDVNREILSASQELREVDVLTYGSHRRRDATVPGPNPPARCLIMPDGLESECLILFDFAFQAARALRDVEFRLRMHPYYPFEDLAKRYRRLRKLPENVTVSDRADISDDFADSAWAVYRGSSASVHAILMGVRPLYLERAGELPFDPLFAAPGWRRRIANVDALRAIIAADRAADAEARRAEWEPARAFCDRYVVAPKPDVIHALITRETSAHSRKASEQ